MFCKEFENDSILYLYNELDAEASQKFETHIIDCSKCQMALSQFSEAMDLYRKLGTETPSMWLLFLLRLKSRIFAYSITFKKILSKFFEPKKLWIPAAVSSVALILICLSLFGVLNNPKKQAARPDEMLEWTILSDDSISSLDRQIDEIFAENFSINEAKNYSTSRGLIFDEDLGLTKIQQDIIILSWDINQSYF